NRIEERSDCLSCLSASARGAALGCPRWTRTIPDVLQVAIDDLLLIEAVQFYLLLQNEQQFLAPVPLQTLRNILCRGFHLGPSQSGQYLGIPLPLQDGSDDLHPADTAEVAQHVTELNIHLCQRLLQALNRAAGFCHQIPSVPPQRARDPDLVGRLE